MAESELAQKLSRQNQIIDGDCDTFAGLTSPSMIWFCPEAVPAEPDHRWRRQTGEGVAVCVRGIQGVLYSGDQGVQEDLSKVS